MVCGVWWMEGGSFFRRGKPSHYEKVFQNGVAAIECRTLPFCGIRWKGRYLIGGQIPFYCFWYG